MDRVEEIEDDISGLVQKNTNALSTGFAHGGKRAGMNQRPQECIRHAAGREFPDEEIARSPKDVPENGPHRSGAQHEVAVVLVER